MTFEFGVYPSPMVSYDNMRCEENARTEDALALLITTATTRASKCNSVILCCVGKEAITNLQKKL
jgi:hypothetical protein